MTGETPSSRMPCQPTGGYKISEGLPQKIVENFLRRLFALAIESLTG
jgi:hypothetical protein